MNYVIQSQALAVVLQAAEAQVDLLDAQAKTAERIGSPLKVITALLAEREQLKEGIESLKSELWLCSPPMLLIDNSGAVA